MGSDFRVEAWTEACKCLKIASGLDAENPLMWANLLGGIANLMVVSVPPEVVRAEEFQKANRRKAQEEFRKHFDDVLPS